MGGATVVGHVLQPAEQCRLVLWTRLLGLWLLLQGQAVLPAGTLPRADHAVDLPEALQGAIEDTEIRLCVIPLIIGGNIIASCHKLMFVSASITITC